MLWSSHVFITLKGQVLIFSQKSKQKGGETNKE